MKILFVWTGVTSYMADCWRELAVQPGTELKVVIEEKARPGTDFRASEVMAGLDATIVDSCGAQSAEDWLGEWRPDVVFVVGWHAATCRRFALSSKWDGVPKVCAFDMPWRLKVRTIAARFVLRRYLRRFSAAFVPGRAAEKYARWLGFRRIEKGLFGIRTEKFATAGRGDRAPYFLYVGRNSPEKRLDVLRNAYAEYSAAVPDPWPLRMFGQGLEGGFAQPDEMPALYAGAGALVLASDFDPWPLVVAESCAAGLPVICTDRCTNHFELLRENGMVVKAGDVRAMAEAMTRMHDMGEDERHSRGNVGRRLVAPYSCREWAQRVLALAADLAG